MKDKLTAGILGIFLGGIGVHRFYLGHIGKGIIYLLFFWTFIPALVGLIEGIGYLTMSQAEFNEYIDKRNDKRTTVLVVNKADELTKFHSLKEQGVITQEEFEKKKKELLK